MAKYDIRVPRCIKKQVTNEEAHITGFKTIVLETVSTDNTVPEKAVEVYQMVGTNPTQDFVSYYDLKGKFLGGLLKVKGEKFWQVWDENQHVVTEPIHDPNCPGFEPHKWRTIGSLDQEEADNILEQRIRSLLNL